MSATTTDFIPPLVGFTGKELDVETGLYYFGARYYSAWSVEDPALRGSRWLSVDPLAEKYPGWSPYNYAEDNPIALLDILGGWTTHAQELQFYRTFGVEMVSFATMNGIPENHGLLMLAHKLHESGWNTHPAGYNFFGMTGSKGIRIRGNDHIFRAFPSARAGFKGYLDFLHFDFPNASRALFSHSAGLHAFYEGLKHGKVGAWDKDQMGKDNVYESDLKTMYDQVLRQWKEVNGNALVTKHIENQNQDGFNAIFGDRKGSQQPTPFVYTSSDATKSSY